MPSLPRIAPAELDDPRVVALLHAHLARAEAVSPPGTVHALDLSGLKQADVTVWAAWEGETLLGIGALRMLDAHHGEVKSMHTAEAARRRGVAAALLARIMAEARRRGAERLSLETGGTLDFAPAHALYARHGFARCPPFGGYRDDGFSICMTRALD